MDFETGKTLGGIGAILMIVGVLGGIGIPYAGLASLIGMILVLVALKGMADYYQESGIFNNALYGLITTIVGVVIFAGVIVTVVLSMLSSAGIDLTNPLSIQEYFMNLTLENLMTLLVGSLAAIVVFFIFLVISAVFFRKSLNSLSAKSGEKMFGWAGLLWLIGAVLSIVAIGFILIFISWILIAVGFFSIKKAAAPATPTSSNLTST
jgi:uncharacterized membrane protein